MTIQAAGNRVSFVCNGSTTVFPVNLQAYLATDFSVMLTSSAGTSTSWTLNNQYSLTASGTLQPTYWTLTATTAPASGYTLQVFVNPSQTQQTNYIQGQAFPSLAVLTNFDRLTQMVQRLQDQINRSIRAQDGDLNPLMQLPIAASRASTNLGFDAYGNVAINLALLSGQLSAATIATFLYPILAGESNVVNGIYPYGDLRRYGGDPTGTNDSSQAWATAIAFGTAIIPVGRFLILTGATKTGQVIVQGSGPASQLLCDGTVLTVNSGTGSVLDYFSMSNVTAPVLAVRNPTTPTANVLTLVQSSTALGYQPTVNDPEYNPPAYAGGTTYIPGNCVTSGGSSYSCISTTTGNAPPSATYWTAFTPWATQFPSITTQQIGPNITFEQNASHIEISRIYGNFVTLTLYDAVYSSVHDCDFRAGKNFAGIVFWNINNQVGEGNAAFDNRIQYASTDAIQLSRNYDFQIVDNICLFSGSSGIHTYQDTLIGVDARCYKGLIAGNQCSYNYYDGIDACSSFGTATVVSSYHQVTGNLCFQNSGDGINIDGQFNQVNGNTVALSGRYGIWGATAAGLSFSSVTNNKMIDNNQSRQSGNADIAIVASQGSAPAWSGGGTYVVGNQVSSGGATYLCMVTNSNQVPPNASYWNLIQPGSNVITGNEVYCSYGQNNYGIYAPGTNFVGDNYAMNGATFFFGNVGAVSSVVQNVTDSTSGLLTDQCFTLAISNVAGNISNAFYAEPGAAGQSLLLSRIIGATTAYGTCPTGTDASTAMANGGKIGSASQQIYWCNTAYQQSTNADMLSQIIYNDTGTQVLVQTQFSPLNINGANLVRLCFVFTIAGTGAVFNLTTANIASGKTIKVQFKGKLA